MEDAVIPLEWWHPDFQKQAPELNRVVKGESKLEHVRARVGGGCLGSHKIAPGWFQKFQDRGSETQLWPTDAASLVTGDACYIAWLKVPTAKSRH